MKKLVVLKFDGALQSGFRVNLTISNDGETAKLTINGEVPPACEIIEFYQSWCDMYCSFYGLSRIKAKGTKNVNIEALSNGFHQKYQILLNSFNTWLSSESLLHVKKNLEKLNQQDEIRVIISTNCQELRKLPWHLWDVLQQYKQAEVALSAPNAERGERIYRDKARILIVLGDSTGIDVQADRRLLEKYCSNGEIILLEEPSRKNLIHHLQDNVGWDMLFFSGHSHTEGTQGRIFLNKNESLTMGELRDALQVAINKRLQIAFFNSCDGLGIASELEQLNIPQVIVMREPVPDKVAQEFLKHFLEAFTHGKSLYISVKCAREKLYKELDIYFPCASWLPVIIQNQLETPPTWQSLGIISLCPYRGLEIFREEHAEFFFGREAFVDKLTNDVVCKPLVAVVGASGSGKSSTIFAGLIPKLRQNSNTQWQIISFRPSSKPLESLALALEDGKSVKCKGKRLNRRQRQLELERDLRSNKLSLQNTIEDILPYHEEQNDDEQSRLLLVVDQFEEIFTLCTNVQEREIFINELLQAIKNTGRFTLIITLRADFLGKAMSYQPLGKALENYLPSLLASMSRQELEKAITLPALKYCVEFEPGLVNKLIDDVGNREGSLALQEFALTLLWQKQRPGKLTHQAYQEIGRVCEAIANHAENVYKSLNKEQQKVLPRIFIQLVQPGEGTEDTRRVATKREVGEENWSLVQYLASERLVVTNFDECKNQEETVEIVHEALIKEWRTLQNWIQNNREFRTWQERLKLEVREWRRNNYDSGRLLQETRLSVALQWYKIRALELTQDERKFIKDSEAKRNKRIREKQFVRRLIVFGLTLGLIIVSILAGLSEIRKIEAEVVTFSITAENYFRQSDHEAALTEAIKAGKLLKTVWQPWIAPEIFIQAVSTLQEKVDEFQIRSLKGHKNRVKGISFSYDGKILASASLDGTVKLWDTQSYKVIKTLAESSKNSQISNNNKFKTHNINVISFSPVNNILASGSFDGMVQLWNTQTDEVTLFPKHHTNKINGISFSQDGNIIASASFDKIVLWDKTGKVINRWEGNTDGVRGVSFNSDGSIIASTSNENTVRLWNTSTKKLLQTLRGHTSQVNSISFNPTNDSILASASMDDTIKLWDTNTGQEIKTLKGHTASVMDISFSPDGKTLASVSLDKTVKLWGESISSSPLGVKTIEPTETLQLWSTDTGTSFKTLNDTSSVNSVNFKPDGKTIAAASFDGTVKLLDISTNRKITIIQGRHNDKVRSISFSSGSKDGIFASASDDKTIKLWNYKTGKEIKTFSDTAWVWAVSFQPNSDILASTTYDGIITLRDVSTRKVIKIFQESSSVNSIRFSPDGKMLASALNDGTITLRNINTNKVIKLKGHKNGVRDIDFSPDGAKLASASNDKTVKLWDVNTAKEIKFLALDFQEDTQHTKEVVSIKFSPDGAKLASASNDKTVRLWDINKGTLITTLIGHTGEVNALSFSSDGKTLASASNDRTVKIWNTSTGRVIETLKGYTGSILDISFSPNRKILAAALSDGRIIASNFDLDYLLPKACELIEGYVEAKDLCSNVKN